jgi:hypothetical protein
MGSNFAGTCSPRRSAVFPAILSVGDRSTARNARRSMSETLFFGFFAIRPGKQVPQKMIVDLLAAENHQQ